MTAEEMRNDQKEIYELAAMLYEAKKRNPNISQLNIPVYVGNKEICKEFNCSPATAVKIMKNVKVANKDKKNPYERKVPLSWVLEMYGE